jgi:hypothetical protein
MGFNWSNKNARDVEIERTRGQVQMNESNNRTSVEKQSNKVKLLQFIAQGVISLISSFINNSRKDE